MYIVTREDVVLKDSEDFADKEYADKESLKEKKKEMKNKITKNGRIKIKIKTF